MAPGHLVRIDRWISRERDLKVFNNDQVALLCGNECSSRYPLVRSDVLPPSERHPFARWRLLSQKI